MTDRDRLIDLIVSADISCFGSDKPYAEVYADYLIANGVTVNEWRPASEPPKKSGEYIVMIEGGSVATTLYFSKFHSGWYEVNDDDFAFSYDITHWMPLPQPQKEVE